MSTDQNPENPNVPLTLLYDATCTVCSSVAKTLRDQQITGLSVHSLQEPRMRALLAEAGHDGLFEPALLEASAGAVSVYTGLRMRVHLARRIGVRNSLRVMRALLDTTAPDPANSRRRFLRGAGVLGVAALVVPQLVSRSATAGAPPAGAEAAPGGPFTGADISSTRDLSPQDVRRELEDPAIGGELDRTLAATQSRFEEYSGELATLRDSIESDPSLVVDVLKGADHALADGGTLTAVALGRGNVLVTAYRHVPAGGGEAQVRTMVHEVDEGAGKAHRLSIRESGETYLPTASIAQTPCDSNADCSGACMVCRGECDSIDLQCAFACCAACTLTCAGGAIVCMACLAVYCPVCLSVMQCCTGGRYCQWRESCA